MAVTRPASNTNGSEGTEGLTGLAHAIEHIDRDVDSRDCRHDSCHGSLHVTDGVVICGHCRCTPDGVYIPPDDTGAASNLSKSRCSQYTFVHPRGRHVSGAEPHPSRRTNGNNRDSYGHTSGECSLTRVRMPGGFERVYDEDDDHRPDGVTDEYTFDLSTL